MLKDCISKVCNNDYELLHTLEVDEIKEIKEINIHNLIKNYKSLFRK